MRYAERARIYEFLSLEAREARSLEKWDLTEPGIPNEQSQGFFRKGMYCFILFYLYF